MKQDFRIFKNKYSHLFEYKLPFTIYTTTDFEMVWLDNIIAAKGTTIAAPSPDK